MTVKCSIEKQQVLRNPKLGSLSPSGKSSWYHYYAGYSPKFVKDVLNYLDLSPGSTVLDPWNGSGTTTQVASDMGFSVIGYDINPVMVIVAKAKMLDEDVKSSSLSITSNIINNANNYEIGSLFDNEPLETWLMPNSALVLRGIERAIYEDLISNDYNTLYVRKSFSDVSNLAAFFYTALFRTLKRLLKPFHTSNPTWIKTPKTQNNKISPPQHHIYSIFENQVSDMVRNFDKSSIYLNSPVKFQIDAASSTSIPLPDNSIHAVISSPPYCTRIDYAIATKPELALLGCSMDDNFRELRNNMIGTPTILDTVPNINPEWGPTCKEFLNMVKNHSSKASKSYYFKYYLQYFHMIYESLIEIDRVTTESSKCVLVVQDSYYKNINNNLSRIIVDMAYSLGWSQLNQIDFDTKRTMTCRNRNSKKYRSRSKATESVLIFKN